MRILHSRNALVAWLNLSWANCGHGIVSHGQISSSSMSSGTTDYCIFCSPVHSSSCAYINGKDRISSLVEVAQSNTRMGHVETPKRFFQLNLTAKGKVTYHHQLRHYKRGQIP